MPTRSSDNRNKDSYQLKEVIQDYTEKLGEITYLNRKLKEELELVISALKKTNEEKNFLITEFNTINRRKDEFDKLILELENVKNIKDQKISELSRIIDQKDIECIKYHEESKLLHVTDPLPVIPESPDHHMSDIDAVFPVQDRVLELCLIPASFPVIDGHFTLPELPESYAFLP